MARRAGIWFIALYFAVLTRAYVIDDSNSTIQYSGLSTSFGGQSWSHNVSAPVPPLDINMLYNGTCTYAICFESDNCHIRIPFTGSGITVYSLLWVQINTSFTVDGSYSQFYVHDDSCFRTTPAGCYNIETYNLQYLKYDNHILDIALLAYDGSSSNFVFDYAVVNETATTLTSAIETVTASASATATANHNSVGAIVGGVISGLAIAAGFVIALCYLLTRNRSKTTTYANPDLASRSNGPDPLQPQPPVPIGMSWSGNPLVGFDGGVPPTQPLTSNVYHQITYPAHHTTTAAAPRGPPAAQAFTLINGPVLPALAPVSIAGNPTQGPTDLQLSSIRNLARRDVPTSGLIEEDRADPNTIAMTPSKTAFPDPPKYFQ